jgi:hypothetical protein
MNRQIAVFAFAASLLGLFSIFEIVPGVGSFVGSVLIVIGGTVLVLTSLRSNEEAIEIGTHAQSVPAGGIRSISRTEANGNFMGGLAAGAVVTLAVGFSFGAWTLASTARFITQETSSIAVVAALAPICVDQFRRAPELARNLSDLRNLDRLDQMTFVQAGGWSLMPGGGAGGAAVAQACAAILIRDASDDELGTSDRPSGSRGR